jgi:N-acyl-L-homoserine lactone synthetase
VTERGDPGALDDLAATLAARSGLRFAVATTETERAIAYRLRRDAVREKQWDHGAEPLGASERDDFDELAVHVIGSREGDAVCCGRLVLPPGPLPTELACGIVVEPVGRVVDVGRMVVVPASRGRNAGAFLALLAALYLETRARGYTTGCGMMAPNVRALIRHLGVRPDVLGPDRLYRGEQRAPVRFEVAVHGPGVLHRWT